MESGIILAAILLSIGVGWSIGANDAANSLGTAVGSRVITLRQGILLIVVFGLLGAILQGGHVVKTIGRGIVPLHELDSHTRASVAMVGAFSACLWVAVATYLKMPVSTSHSIVGAVAGVGLAMGLPVNWMKVRGVFLCWILTPAGSMLLGYVIFRALQNLFPRLVPERLRKGVLTLLVVSSGCYVAFSWGANDVANATGVLAGTKLLSPGTSVMLGGLAIALGIVTWGYKVIETIGSQITHLMPLMAFCAQLASGLNVHFYTLLGMPVSTSHSIVGAIVGVGLVRGVRVVNLGIMKEIAVCWLATPLASGLISYACTHALIGFKIV